MTTETAAAETTSVVNLSKPATEERPKRALLPGRKRAKKEDVSGIGSLNGKWAYLFTAPFFLMFIIFGILPVVYSVYIAFFSWDPLDPSNQNFVGLDNFRILMEDGNFWNAVRNTFAIWFFSSIPQMFMSIGLAAVLRNPTLRGKTFFRSIMLVPNITSVLAVAIIFGQLFGRDYGLINWVVGLLGFEHIDWIEQTIPGQVAIAIMITWRWVGYNALIFLASMLAIPNELFESASIDGASKWQTFRYVTLPQLRNTITFVLIMGTIGGMQVFAEPLTLGGAAGGSSRQFQTLTLYLYEQAFVNVNWGYGASIGIAITIIVLIVSFINFLITRRMASEDKR